MSEQEQTKQSKFLDFMINCIREVQKKQLKGEKNLQNLYSEAEQLIKRFDVNIDRCKKYNQAKINRKYQIIINDLQSQVKKLNKKLKIQQDARSPTKKHVTQILNQLIVYKEQNQKLKKQLLQSKELIKQLKNKNQIQANAIKNLQNTQPKALVERLPSLNSKGTICDCIKQFLKDKENIRKVISNTPTSSFEKFLNNQIVKAWNWTVGNLLQEIDKWAQGIKPTKQVDMWKIRSSVAKNFSDYIEDSNFLTRPSSLNKGSSSGNVLNSILSQKNKFTKKHSRFSGISEKRQKSMISPVLH